MSGPFVDVAEILELLGRQFKTAMVNILRALLENADSLQEKMGNVSEEMEILRSHQKEMLDIRNTVIEMKVVCNGLHSRLDKAKKRTSVPEDRSESIKCLFVLDTVLGASEQDRLTYVPPELPHSIHSSQVCLCPVSPIVAAQYHPSPDLGLF